MHPMFGHTGRTNVRSMNFRMLGCTKNNYFVNKFAVPLLSVVPTAMGYIAMGDKSLYSRVRCHVGTAKEQFKFGF